MSAARNSLGPRDSAGDFARSAVKLTRNAPRSAARIPRPGVAFALSATQLQARDAARRESRETACGVALRPPGVRFSASRVSRSTTDERFLGARPDRASARVRDAVPGRDVPIRLWFARVERPRVCFHRHAMPAVAARPFSRFTRPRCTYLRRLGAAGASMSYEPPTIRDIERVWEAKSLPTGAHHPWALSCVHLAIVSPSNCLAASCVCACLL